MNLSLSSLLAVLLVLLSFESYSKGIDKKQQEQLQKLRTYENKVEKLYGDLSDKAQKILPPLKALNVSAMSFDDLVEVQKILAQFYALDSKLSALPQKLRSPLSRQDFPALEKEIQALETLIYRL